ncbi:ORF64 [White spot syndrome virus]|uniref:Wsv090 n=5 Tax=White spot syndrome virus TaxID=342409 RepID=Q77J82_WSSVS|nr:wsv090 [Shrimp white spot syndrome virus]YP_009220502.1 hypothetical protein SWSSV_gp028 [White spot syndrome virus]AAK77733.1 ORF64 [White spot syndrome virus]AAL33094.1 wsv090 [Shrimp white spot syndrome virus]AAL89015.1 WSSV147 [Shrimp white spot syndrome virus]AFX59467.1 wsv090 [White spot syndrome virus]ALN66154.1 hypothetical protein [White spot syndrome virus]
MASPAPAAPSPYTMLDSKLLSSEELKELTSYVSTSSRRSDMKKHLLHLFEEHEKIFQFIQGKHKFSLYTLDFEIFYVMLNILLVEVKNILSPIPLLFDRNLQPVRRLWMFHNGPASPERCSRSLG